MRRRITKQVQLLESMCRDSKNKDEDLDIDELAWEIEKAKGMLDDLRRLKITAPEPEPSHHEESLTRCIFISKRILKKLESSPPDKKPDDCVDELKIEQPGKPPPTVSTYQLQQMNLPSFSGSDEQWPSFSQTFIHEVDRLPIPAVSKFITLRRLVTGEAERSIRGLALNDANYHVAWVILQKRFSKPDQRKTVLMKRLASVSGLAGNLPPHKMRESIDLLVATVRDLESIGMDESQFGELVRPIIEEKLPEAWGESWARRKRISGFSPSFSNLWNS